MGICQLNGDTVSWDTVVCLRRYYDSASLLAQIYVRGRFNSKKKWNVIFLFKWIMALKRYSVVLDWSWGNLSRNLSHVAVEAGRISLGRQCIIAVWFHCRGRHPNTSSSKNGVCVLFFQEEIIFDVIRCLKYNHRKPLVFKIPIEP